jgi:putative ABC transport system ATP-binding protein
MMTVDKLTKVFSSGDTNVHAVDKVSFTVETGSFASIIGKSGSGKSTLLAMLGALENPTSGVITVDGKIITSLSGKQQTNYRSKDIGFVFQGYNLIPNLSALENVMLPMEFGSLPKSEQKSRAVSLLEKVGLDDDKQSRKPGRLSGGEQQRVAIARALANKPALPTVR